MSFPIRLVRSVSVDFAEGRSQVRDQIRESSRQRTVATNQNIVSAPHPIKGQHGPGNLAQPPFCAVAPNRVAYLLGYGEANADETSRDRCFCGRYLHLQDEPRGGPFTTTRQSQEIGARLQSR